MKSSYRRIDGVRRVDGVEGVDAENPGRQRIGAAALLPTGLVFSPLGGRSASVVTH